MKKYNKIIGVNFSHNTSACVLENGKVTKFLNEDRLVNIKKYETLPGIKSLFSLNKTFSDDVKIIGYASYFNITNKYKNIPEDLHKKYSFIPKFYDEKKHHIYHAICGFYFSNFNEALAIIVDGGGAEPLIPSFQEIESIYYINNKFINEHFKHLSNKSIFPGYADVYNWSDYIGRKKINGTDVEYSSLALGGHLFKVSCSKIGFKDKHGHNEAGKLMGLSSYKNKEEENELDKEKVEIAHWTQQKHFERGCYLIEKALTYNKTKNIILSGGCALNCSNNFKFVKKYPKLNFFIDPLPEDQGTAIGVAKYIYDYL